MCFTFQQQTSDISQLSCSSIYFPVEVVGSFDCVGEIPQFVTIRITEQYFPVVLFIMLYKVVFTFESVDEILWCDQSNESYWAVLSCGIVYFPVDGGSKFWLCGWNPTVSPFTWKLLLAFCWINVLPFRPSYSMFECWRMTEQLRSQTLSLLVLSRRFKKMANLKRREQKFPRTLMSRNLQSNQAKRSSRWRTNESKEVTSSNLPNTFNYQ